MKKKLITVGWREWVSLPDLGLTHIKAKVDTGARTSCLHAANVTPFIKNTEQWVHFVMHPNQGDSKTEVICKARVIDERVVTDSGGHKESRYVISTQLVLGDHHSPIEITLTNRDNMRFRMLLGREAMKKKIIVDPGSSYLLEKPTVNIDSETN